MNKETFDALAEKRLGGAFAFMTGRVKLDGSLVIMK
jgi:putative sterol carrier protein